MPIYLRSLPGSKQGGDIVGPYEESKIQKLREYASGLSERNKNTVEIHWICGRRRPMYLAIYKEGRQLYPSTTQEEKQLQNVSSCISRPGASGKSLERSPRELSPKVFSKARKLPSRFACPARIVSTPPLQDFTLPSPVTDVGGERVLGNPILPPLGLPGRFSPISPLYWTNRQDFVPESENR